MIAQHHRKSISAMMAKKLMWCWYDFSLPSHFAMFRTTCCANGALSTHCARSSQTPRSLGDMKFNGDLSQFGSYKEAIHALNRLQSNAQVIQLATIRQLNHLEDTRKYVQRSGIELEQLDKLSVIHVSGTKGKGSTCALTESILRTYGLRTGFFSSPHLVSVTERIRINGESITQEKFTKHFWKVYNRLNCQKDHENDMPAYFKFLTILSFHVFLEENVDVAIYEVGIGGEKDCTNILRTTKTVGITSLGLEHTALLGNTMTEIARQKAGIIKPNSNVFTLNQSEECLNVIRQVANERGAKLFIVPDFNDYTFPRYPDFQIKNKVQHLNASLAIQLAYDWLLQNCEPRLNGLVMQCRKSRMIRNVSKEVVEGLEKCIWLGRCQVLNVGNKTIHLDGAHTKESLDVCAGWFVKVAKDSSRPKCLIFNAIGDRDSEQLMTVLAQEIKFTTALFVPNIAYITDDGDETSEIKCQASETQIERAFAHARLWPKIQNSPVIASFSSVLDAVSFLDEQFNAENIDVLITGSLNLVGAALIAIEKYMSPK